MHLSDISLSTVIVICMKLFLVWSIPKIPDCISYSSIIEMGVKGHFLLVKTLQCLPCLENLTKAF